MIFRTFFLLFTASIRSRPPGPPAVPGVFHYVFVFNHVDNFLSFKSMVNFGFTKVMISDFLLKNNYFALLLLISMHFNTTSWSHNSKNETVQIMMLILVRVELLLSSNISCLCLLLCWCLLKFPPTLLLPRLHPSHLTCVG